MEEIKNPAQKITHKIKTGTVSATFGIILILVLVLFAGWHVYDKYRSEGLIRPLFGEPQVVESQEETIYEDYLEE